MTAALLSQQQFFNPLTGGFLNGGTITSYQAGGTSTPLSIYTSSSGSSGSSYANPLTLSAYGDTTNGLWLEGYYRLIIKDSAGNTVHDWDNVSAGNAAVVAATNTPVSASQSSRNLLINSAFTSFTKNGTSSTTVADTAEAADNWQALSSTGNMTSQQLTSTGSTRFNTALRLTNTSGGTQRMGLEQFCSAITTPEMVGLTVQASIDLNLSISGNCRVALLSGISTTDAAHLVDVVNTWGSGTYTQGNFFSANAAISVITVSSFTMSPGTWQTCTLSGVVPANSTGLYLFAWTESSVANSVTLDFGAAQIYENSTALDWRPAAIAVENSHVGGALFVPAYDSAMTIPTLTSTTGGIISKGLGTGIATGVQFRGASFTHTLAATNPTAARTSTLPDCNVGPWVVGIARAQGTTGSTATTLSTATAPTTGNTVALGTTVSYTAKLSTNPLEFRGAVSCIGTVNTNISAIFLFKDTTLIWSGGMAAQESTIPIAFTLAAGAGDTSAHTYALYIVQNTGSSGVTWGQTTSVTTWNGSTVCNAFNLIEWSA